MGFLQGAPGFMTSKRRRRLKTAELNVRITPRLKAIAQKAAERDQRSLSSLVEKLLTEYCEKIGLIKSK
jgi:predicted HicB family RNase H-like nuclease